jgi:hypothetical protein
MTMRVGAGIILGIAAILIASPARAQGRYDTAYSVCMEVYGGEGSRIECFFTSMEQCKLGTTGTAGMCFNNPYYVAPPPEPAVVPVAEPAAKPAKSAKSAKTAKSQQPPPSQQAVPTQQR